MKSFLTHKRLHGFILEKGDSMKEFGFCLHHLTEKKNYKIIQKITS